jgi:hypothetical protein
MVLTTCTSTLLDWPWITVLGIGYPLDCLDSLLDGLESTPYPTPSRPTSSLSTSISTHPNVYIGHIVIQLITCKCIVFVPVLCYRRLQTSVYRRSFYISALFVKFGYI